MDQVAQIRDKIDIVSLIASYIPLKRAGRNFKANCPFHTEKTPSFIVSPERQIWRCFGCQKSGDCYTFLMEYERLEFPEALRMLAKQAGVELTTTPSTSATALQKERIFVLNKLAAELYHYILTNHPAGKKSLAYLSSRISNSKLIDTFTLGFAPERGNVLANYLLKKKQYSANDLVSSGLVFQKGKDTIDFFRGRLMFPLFDHRGNIIGFSGRVIDDSLQQSKYINTKDTLVYHKGETLFGLHVAKEAMKKAEQVILVEGEFDVISCFGEGISNVLAVKGTALTEQQVNLLARFVKKVVICFDGDAAGQNAIKRSLPILEKKGLATSVVVIPHGKDPDEAIKKDSGAFKQAIKHDVNAYEYLIMQTIASVDQKTAEGKKTITDTLLPILSDIDNEVVREHHLRRLSAELETTIESLQKELEKRKEKRYLTPQAVVIPMKRSREEILEEYLLSIFVQSAHPKAIAEQIQLLVADNLLQEQAYQKILLLLAAYLQHHQQFEANQFGKTLSSELLQAYNTCFVFPLPKLDTADAYEKEAAKTVIELRKILIKEKIKELGEEIAKKETSEEGETSVFLQEQLSSFIQLLQDISDKR